MNDVPEDKALTRNVCFSVVQGKPLPQPYSHLTQPLPGNRSVPGNSSFDDDRAASSYDPAMASNPSASQFVPNPAGFGPRAVPKRSTFKRTNRVDASTEDLLHDQQQQQQAHLSDQYQMQQSDYNHPSSSLHAPQHVRHPSGLRPHAPGYLPGNNTSIRPRLVHGAHDSRNSSGHDSGLSSGGTSFDPEQHHLRHLGNPNQPMTLTTPQADVYDVPPQIPLPRRKSLPSIVKTIPGDYRIDETARSSDNLPGNETFIIENGIRKRVTEQAPTYTDSGTPLPQATVMTSSSGSPTLARRIILESVQRVDVPASTTSSTGGNKRGSMPTIANVARKRQAAPSRSTGAAKEILSDGHFFSRRYIQRGSNSTRFATTRRTTTST